MGEMPRPDARLGLRSGRDRWPSLVRLQPVHSSSLYSHGPRASCAREFRSGVLRPCRQARIVYPHHPMSPSTPYSPTRKCIASTLLERLRPCRQARIVYPYHPVSPSTP